MAGNSVRYISYNGEKSIKLIKWQIKNKSKISKGTCIFLYENANDVSDKDKSATLKYRSIEVGTVKKLLKNEDDIINIGNPLLELEECAHPIVMKEMCAECGADLKQVSCSSSNFSASVAMVHSIPELIVSQEQAHVLGKADEDYLLKNRKLVLLVDLDQTLIHTTNDHIPPNIKDVYHFQLYGSRSPWYHTRLRPGTRQFLENISKYYELHICTFGARPYAHMIAHILDKDGKFFSHRILSRDECFNPTSKTGNLKALFPCGDSMVCIIDDREDVWNYSPNLIHVKPYHFFQHTGDINAPPGLAKTEYDSEKPKFVVNTTSKKKDTESNSASEDEISNNAVDETSVVLQDKKTVSSSNVDESTEENEKSFVEKSSALSSELSTLEAFDTLNPSLPENKSMEIISDTGDPVYQENVQVECDSLNKNKNEVDENIGQSFCNPDDDLVVHDDPIESKEDLTNDLVVHDDPIESKEDLTNDELDNGIEEDKFTEENSNATIGDITSCNGDVIIQDDDDHLLHLEDKLCRIHKAYYEQYDKFKVKGKREIPDIKYIVPNECKKVLKGSNIVFSGVFPTNMPPEKSKAWIVAKCLGAVIQSKIIRHKGRENMTATTHLIAARLGTAKVNEAKKLKHIHIVNPHWLWCCAERWEKVDESLFPLTKDTSAEFSVPLFKHNSRCEPILENTFTQSRRLTDASKQMEVFPLYDPVTGKRINRVALSQNISSKTEHETNGGKNKSSKNETFVNPLLSFSSTDIAKMDQEVDDAFNESDSESEGKRTFGEKRKKYSSSDESDSSEESLSADYPRGWRNSDKKIKLQQDADDIESDSESEMSQFPRSELPHDSGKSELNSSDSDFEDSVGSVDEEMAAAVEREFLGY